MIQNTKNFSIVSYQLQQDRLYHIYEQQSKWLEFKHKRFGALNGSDESDRLQTVLEQLDDWYNLQIDLLQEMANNEWAGKTYEK